MAGDAVKSPCAIDVVVHGDIEHFDSADSFRESLTLQGVNRFSCMRICAEGADCSVEIKIAREPKGDRDVNVTFGWEKGVSLEVSSKTQPATILDVREKLIPVIDRGSIAGGRLPFSGSRGEPKKSPAEHDLNSTLATLRNKRRSLVQTAFIVAVGLPIVAAWLVFQLVEKPHGLKPVPLYRDPFILLIGGLSIAQALSLLAPGFFFPAVDMADITPGRRALRFVGRSGALSIGSAVAAAWLKKHLNISP